MDWISVDESLPEPVTPVLVHCEGNHGQTYDIAMIAPEKSVWLWAFNSCPFEVQEIFYGRRVTYWAAITPPGTPTAV